MASFPRECVPLGSLLVDLVLHTVRVGGGVWVRAWVRVEDRVTVKVRVRVSEPSFIIRIWVRIRVWVRVWVRVTVEARVPAMRCGRARALPWLYLLWLYLLWPARALPWPAPHA